MLRVAGVTLPDIGEIAPTENVCRASDIKHSARTLQFLPQILDRLPGWVGLAFLFRLGFVYIGLEIVNVDLLLRDQIQVNICVVCSVVVQTDNGQGKRVGAVLYRKKELRLSKL